jgi:hypothetical protein
MLRIHFDKKMRWATFWARLSETHLVTLLAVAHRTRTLTLFSARKKYFRKFLINFYFLSLVHQGCQMVCFQTKNPNLGKF